MKYFKWLKTAQQKLNTFSSQVNVKHKHRQHSKECIWEGLLGMKISTEVFL